MNRLRHLGPAAAVLMLAAGCGGSAPSTVEAESTSPPSTPATSPRGTVDVTQTGTTAPKTMWFVRIESPGFRPLAEAGFPDRPVSFTRELPAGRYRVIAWRRTCTGACPATGETGLSPLEDVCGTVVSVASGRRVHAVVQIGADGGCTVATGP